MKKILLACLLLGGLSTFAQADIKVKLINPAEGSSFASGVAFNVDIRIVNTGTVPIDAMDTIIYAPLINGGFIGNGQGGSVIYAQQVAVPAGDSTTLTQSLNLSGGTAGALDFCGIAVVTGMGWSGVTEADTTDNTDCNAVTYTTGGVSTAEFTVTTTTDDSYFANGTYHVIIDNISLEAQPQMRVFNITGQEVLTTSLFADGNSISQEVSLRSLNRGVYIVQVLSGSRSISSKKIVVN